MKNIIIFSMIVLLTGITFFTGCIKEELDTPPVKALLIDESFKDSLGSFTQFSVTGAQVWTAGVYSGKTYATMSGYDGSYNANIDWLISSPINFDKYNEETLSFETAMKYGAAGDGSFKVFTSADYNGTEHPDSATWNEIIPDTISTGNFSWINSGLIDLSAVTGANVYLAFKYTCTTSAVPTWEISTIKLKGIAK